MSRTRKVVVVLLFLGAVALETRQLESPRSVGAKSEKATFAGGCFWCMEPPFDKL